MICAQDIPRDPRAPSLARRMVDDLDGMVIPTAADHARLLLSELVTNAVRHGEGSTIRVVLDAGTTGQLRCEVVDEGPGFVPTPRNKPSTDVGGWGLHLVETLAHRWGVRDDSTLVWFELVAPPGA